MPEKPEVPEEPRLLVGLVSLNRRLLLSPPGETPDLFLSPRPLMVGQSIEHTARSLIHSQGIAVSALCALVSPRDTFDRGYALRTAQATDAEEYGLKAYSTGEVIDYLDAHPTDDLRRHFLRQIVRYMGV